MSKHSKTKENEINNTSHRNSKRIIKRKRRHLWGKLLLVLIIALGIFIGIRLYRAGGNILMAILGHDKHTVDKLDKLNVLILGESTGMSDTIIAASYDPKTQEAAMLSIPRDTFTGDVKSEARYYHKINSLYNYGETPEKTVDAVNKITGLDINYYILIDTEALIKMVDTLNEYSKDGFMFDVPIDMNYDDYSQDLHIHLEAGYQKLTGEQVEQLVRFRHNNNGTSYSYDYGIEDHGRNKTQRNVIMAIAKQTLQSRNIKEISKIIDILKDYVKTNMDLDSIKDYIPYAFDMNMDNVKVGIIPGQDEVVNDIWFFFPDEEGTEEIVDKLFFNKVSSENEDAENTDNNSSND